jgi:hypothetical protein
VSPVATGSHPGLRRPTVLEGGPAPDFPQNQARTRSYRIERFSPFVDGAGVVQYIRAFDTEGDHLYLEELNGSGIVSVCLDNLENGWIEMEEGDTITREFQRFWVRSNSEGSSAPWDSDVEAKFIASYGPVVDRAPKKYGFRMGTIAISGTTPGPGAVDAFGNFLAQYGAQFGPPGRVAALKFGGTILFDNRSATDDMYWYFGDPGSFAGGGGVYPSEDTATRIPAGKQIAFVFENRAVAVFHPQMNVSNITLCIADITAAVDFTITLSRFALDFTDPETLADLGTPPLRD